MQFKEHYIVLEGRRTLVNRANFSNFIVYLTGFKVTAE